jgi:hypothetical protein
MVKRSYVPVRMLAAVVFGLALPASTTAANGSPAGARMSIEYRQAVDRADRDYMAANGRCEVLGMDERKLCRHDSTLARRAAIVEAHDRQLRTASAAR